MRPAPAFQEYASDMLATTGEMQLDEVGLLSKMRWAYWSNHTLPTDPHRLGRIIGVDPRTIKARLTSRVLHHFMIDPTDDQRYFCPELDRQFARLADLRSRQSEGGKQGRAMQLSQSHPEARGQGDPAQSAQGKPRVLNRTGTEQNLAFRGKTELPPKVKTSGATEAKIKQLEGRLLAGELSEAEFCAACERVVQQDRR